MLEPPDISDDDIRAWLLDRHGIVAGEVVFLPLGADPRSASYRVAAASEYFLKLRRVTFDGATVAVPRFLRDAGIAEVLAPLADRGGLLASELCGFNAILYPFIAGATAVERPLSPDQWMAFGRALRQIHDSSLPPALVSMLRRETFSPTFRDQLRSHLDAAPNVRPHDEPAAALADALVARRGAIALIVDRAETLAKTLMVRMPPLVPCHADIHEGNMMVADNGALQIVDWDDVILAPPERDLMFVGSGLGWRWSDPAGIARFYDGYGPVRVDGEMLAYYRYERIVDDIAVVSDMLLASDAGGADRALSLGHFFQQFEPNDVIAVAHATYASI